MRIQTLLPYRTLKSTFCCKQTPVSIGTCAIVLLTLNCSVHIGSSHPYTFFMARYFTGIFYHGKTFLLLLNYLLIADLEYDIRFCKFKILELSLKSFFAPACIKFVLTFWICKFWYQSPTITPIENFIRIFLVGVVLGRFCYYKVASLGLTFSQKTASNCDIPKNTYNCYFYYVQK